MSAHDPASTPAVIPAPGRLRSESLAPAFPQACSAPRGWGRWAWAAALAVSVAAAACGGHAGTDGAVVQRDTVGDTIIVRTVSGSAWGAPARLEEEVRIGVFEGDEHYMFGDVRGIAVDADGFIYAYDSQVPVLRKYAPDGSYVRDVGREGGGPGEYKQSDGGMAVLPDGRLALRDPGNARIQLYDPSGEAAGSWIIRGGFFTSSRMVADSQGGVYTHVLVDPEADVGNWVLGVVRYAPETGEPGEPIAPPDLDYEAPYIEARRTSEGGGVSVSRNGVPFSPGDHVVFSPLGYWIGGISTDYNVGVFRPDGTVLRVSRTWEPVPVTSGEKSDAEARATYNMQRMLPSWRWNGPPIPDTKPAYRDLLAGEDGRIWVLLSQPGEGIEGVEEPGPNEEPPRRWRESVVFDVFEPDGTYLGQVRAPDGFQIYPNPVFRGDHVWGIVEDDFEVQYITRFRVVVEGPETVAGGV